MPTQNRFTENPESRTCFIQPTSRFLAMLRTFSPLAVRTRAAGRALLAGYHAPAAPCAEHARCGRGRGFEAVRAGEAKRKHELTSEL